MTTTTRRARSPRTITHESIAQRTAEVRRAYFAKAPQHARWRIDVDTVVGFARCDRRGWRGTADQWIEDLVIAAACVRGDQEAWHHVELANSWRLREAARLRLSPERAALVVARFWAELRRHTNRGGGHTNLADYCGDAPLAHWLAARLFAAIESPATHARECEFLDSVDQVRTLAADASEAIRMPTAT